MKKKLIIGSSILLIVASVIIHFLYKDPATNSNGDFLDFITGAMFGAGIVLPLLLLDDYLKD